MSTVKRYKGKGSTMQWLSLSFLLILPLATPFCSGSSFSNGNGCVPVCGSPPPPASAKIGVSPNQPSRSNFGRSSAFSSARRSLSAATAEIAKKNNNSNMLSRLLFRYASPLVNKAKKERLDASDSYEVPESRKMETSVSDLSQIYHNYQHENIQSSKKQSESWLLTKALLKHNKKRLLVTGLLRLLNTTIQAFPAILVRRLLVSLEQSQNPASESVRLALYLVALLTVKMLVENQYFDQVVQSSTAVRGSLAGLIFDKSLRLPQGGANVVVQQKSSKLKKDDTNSTTGKAEVPLGNGGVLNLMQSDAGLLESATLQLHTLWDGPLQIAIYTYLLYCYLGSSVFWGIGVLLATIPVNSITLRLLNKLTRRENESKEKRTKQTTESITHMKLLKLLGWERRFADSITGHREEELARHTQKGMVRALSNSISNAVPALVLVVTLTAYTKTGRPMLASTIFTAISLFNQLRFPLFFYPMLIDSLANGANAIRRLSTFLSAPELVPYVTTNREAAVGGITLDNGNFVWPGSDGNSNSTITDEEDGLIPALADAQLRVGPGEIVAVVGSVGSGKTALIKALLGELVPVPSTIVRPVMKADGASDDLQSIVDENPNVVLKPSVVMQGQVAYCSQESWLPKGTLREAVVFGREYSEACYRQAIYDAGLDSDIVEDVSQADASQGMLSHDTDVGEGGSSLSGGQRARVALARALYSPENKVFLLDDCLAALDASVGLTVLERVSIRLRQRQAAALLVTNDPSVPRRCDRVYLMGKVVSRNQPPAPGSATKSNPKLSEPSSAASSSCSTILDVGSYDDLIARGHDLKTISVAQTMSKAAPPSQEGKNPKSQPDKSLLGNYPIGNVNTHSSILGQSEPPRGELRTITVCGKTFNVPLNATDADEWCHADPECQAAMENCPEYVSDRLGDKPALATLSNEVLVHKPFFANNTDAATISEPANVVGELAPVASADDTMSTGAVPLSTYMSYLRSVRKPALIVAMLASYLTVNGAQFFQQYTVAKWTELSSTTSSGIASALGAKYMRSLVNAAGVVSVFLWMRSFFTMQVGVRASSFLHARMLKSVFAAPMSFFDATPSGQVLSRFGKEMETVDRGVPDSIGSVLFCFLQIFMSVGALSAIITPGMLGPIFLVAFHYVRTMSKFRPAARDMKRAETKTRSPIYTQFGEALRGVETIRSIPGAQRMWSKKHRSLTDENLAVFYTVKSFDRWLATRLETLGNVVVFTAAIASVFLTQAGRMQAGSAGWGLTQALAITGLMTWAVRCLTDLETSMLSVIRVKELTGLDKAQTVGEASQETYVMPVEPSEAGEAMQPLLAENNVDRASVVRLAPRDSVSLERNGWPWRGNIEFHNVSMRYNPTSPLVLQGVTLSIPAGTTLGVVGRTGSGKSSLLLTLFRLNEIEGMRDSGISIDGVDIRSVSLRTLRNSLAIIPQDPVLFAGTIAYNLDASGQTSDVEQWAALETASPALARQFRATDGLGSQITEGGRNLSLGQRQLVCLARALLRKSKILVLDEATSSVDVQTDQLVQETIRREFVEKGVTVITVAHRLDTVLGYDKIAVLGSGKVLEYGTPKSLLGRERGELRRLVDADRISKQKGGAKEVDATPETAIAG